MLGIKNMGARSAMAGTPHASSTVQGQPIPVPYGRGRVPGLLIAAGDFVTHDGVTKKGTAAKGRLTGYSMAADFLLGFGPCQGVAGIWFEKNRWQLPQWSQSFTDFSPGLGTVVATPVTSLNGWGANAHVGSYEHSVNQGFFFGLDPGTTAGYTNPNNAVDGNPVTHATAAPQHTHQFLGCVWAFSSIAASGNLRALNINSRVLANGDDGLSSTLRSAGMWYSLDNGVTWTQIYNQGPQIGGARPQQWDTVPLPPGQDVGLVQVMAFTDGHDDMAHYVYDINISEDTGGGGGGTGPFTFTITNLPPQPNGADSLVAMIYGVTLTQDFSVTYNDYGDPGGARTLSGATEIPLHNQAYPAPNNGDWANTGLPYARFNTPASPLANPTFTVYAPGGLTGSFVVTVYYCVGGTTSNVGMKNIGFEQVLGSGSSVNPTSYPEFSGVFSDALDLGVADMSPDFSYEIGGLYGYSRRMDCNPADVILDIVCSGNKLGPTFHQAAGGNNNHLPVWNHGLGFSRYALNIPPFIAVNPAYSRFGGLLYDESDLWVQGSGSFTDYFITTPGGNSIGLKAVRDYCQAYGIFISYTMATQRTGADHLGDLCVVANAAAVFDGAGLALIPRCEVSNYGNGASYVAPTASGPVAELTWNDVIADKDNPAPPIQISVARPETDFNSLILSYTGRDTVAVDPKYGTFRDSNYEPTPMPVADGLDISIQGPLPGSAVQLPWINNAEIAKAVAWVELRRNVMINGRLCSFNLSSAQYGWLTPMDLITMFAPDVPGGMLLPMPLRIINIAEGVDGKMAVTCEKFIYGAHAPFPPAIANANAQGGNSGDQNVSPGVVNTPVIFEPVPNISTSPQLWLGISGSDPNYGGCTIWMSTDGVAGTYKPVGSLVGKATQGAVYSSNFPSHADPDAANTLNADLTECLGNLSSVTTAQRDAFESLVYLAGGGTVMVNGVVLTIPYELVAYANANLSAAHKYAMPPTLRRGVFTTPVAAHNIGSDFLFLSNQAQSENIFQMGLDQNWVGKQLFFKFTAFNIYGKNEQNITDLAVVPYSFTPTGLVGWTWTSTSPSVPPTNVPIPSGNNNPSVAPPYVISVFASGAYAASQVLLPNEPPLAMSLPVGLTGSLPRCINAPTGAVAITIQKNGSSIGTINFAPLATTGTFTFTTATNFNGTGDEFRLIAPATPDVTFAGLYVSFLGARS